MGGLIDALTGRKKDRRVPVPVKPARIDKEGAEAAEEERRRRRREGGRASTILTSPLGVASTPRVASKVLTGS